ncbi:high-potential iron-sulfur protein [Modicisalibacter radicis]|uniref:high-potential iron-sulfur protein n=1 Tax=Halomonas sp. EAR18 TaxID=2518972 RepID=UPI00109D4690|nr:high-potential iron-sulfur protein [Halomonas sp. EAR18]
MANHSRRDFIRHGLLGLVALPFGASVAARQARAQELPPLDPSNPQARALNYVTEASQASDHPAYSRGERCDNCIFYTEANQGCRLFPRHSVAPAGWCQSWARG